MLTSVRLENVRVLKLVELRFGRLTILVGPNGCGKSTVLDQILRLSAMTSGTPGVSELGSVGVVLDSYSPDRNADALRGAPNEPTSWIATTDVDSIRVEIEPATPDRPQWSQRTRVAFDAGWALPSPDAPSRAAVHQRMAAMAFRAQRLQLVPAAIAAPSSVRVERLDPNGHGLPTVLKDLAANDPVAYARVQADLMTIVPQFQELKFGKRDRDPSTGADTGPQNTLDLVLKGAGRVPADRVSDGTLLALALLTATHNRDLPPIVLMDDLDHGLHLTAQLALVEAIRCAQAVRPDVQVIATTHSPYLLDALLPEEVYVMALDGDGRGHARRLDTLPDLARAGLGLQTGELWASVGEDWVVAGD